MVLRTARHSLTASSRSHPTRFHRENQGFACASANCGLEDILPRCGGSPSARTSEPLESVVGNQLGDSKALAHFHIINLPYQRVSLTSSAPEMSFRSFSRALQRPLQRQWTPRSTQSRTVVSLIASARQTTVRRSIAPSQRVLQPVRGVKTIDFAGSKEEVFGKPKCGPEAETDSLRETGRT